MPWPLRKIEIAHADRDETTGVSWWVDAETRERPKVGDCFYVPHFLTSDAEKAGLAPRFWREWASKRPPIVVVLPNKAWWCVDQMAIDSKRGRYGDGWQVTGSIDTTPITLTCTPSINMPATYHGFVTRGVITDDVEGRRFA